MKLLHLEEAGLCCEQGGFHIDPMRAVDLALITHAHSDHARRGSRRYVCVRSGEGLLRERIGSRAPIEVVDYGERRVFGRVVVSFHPAGHILGSAQIRVERPLSGGKGEVWVVSGDYKRDPDPSCEPFEVVPCDTFVTEATFGRPNYEWGDTSGIAEEMAAWWKGNAAREVNSVLYCYSLGKAQRVLAELLPYVKKPIWVHESVAALTECYRKQGVKLAATRSLVEFSRKGVKLEPFRGEFLLIPPSATRGLEMWLGHYETAFASGWMKSRSRYGYDRGFVMSDHADWPALLRTIEETRARRVYVACRNDGYLVRHLRKQGLQAGPISALKPSVQGDFGF